MNGAYIIRGREFPMVNNLTFGDAMFVEAAARMEFEEFMKRMDEWQGQVAAAKESGEERDLQPGDFRVMAGSLAAAVSRVERDWTPQKVARFVWDIDIDPAVGDLKIVPPETVGDPPPLEVAEKVSPSPGSSNESTISAADSPGMAHV